MNASIGRKNIPLAAITDDKKTMRYTLNAVECLNSLLLTHAIENDDEMAITYREYIWQR